MKGKVIKIVCISLAVMLFVSIIWGVILLSNWKKSTNFVSFDKQKLNEVYSGLTVLDVNGKVLEEPLYYNNQKQIPLSSLQKHTYMAFVAVEDKRFFSHDGLDLRRIGGAMLSNIKSNSFKEGASTISQQLIKNTHLDNAKTVQRKINEMMLARQLEKEFSKEEILEMYLNTIYFGRNAFGIENASNVYFNKSASQLSIAESATLAGMIKAPNTYAPDKNLEKCKNRRDVVLRLMVEQEIISQKQYEESVLESITYTPQTIKQEKTYMYCVLQEACKLLNMTECQLLNSNYVIQTYCNATIQKNLYKLASKDTTQGSDSCLANLSCIIADKEGRVEGCYFRGENAMSSRQVGSALKPIAVYTPAFCEKIITQASPVLDEPTDFNGYTPQNAGGYNGWTTIKYSVQKSLNIPSVKTLNALTLPVAEKYLGKLGLTGKQDLSLALGNVNGGLTPLQLAKCYTALANEGCANETRFIQSIKDKKNSIVYQDDTSGKQIFDKASTFLMTDILVSTVSDGTAKNLLSKYQIAAKTGTVGNKSGNSDAIIAGYTTQHTFVVWYNGQLSNSQTGSTVACRFAKSMLDNVYKNSTPPNFTPPKNVVNITVDKNSLHNHQQLKISNSGENYWFDKSNMPTEKLQEKIGNYTLDATWQDNQIVIKTPEVANGEWQLFQNYRGKTTTLALNSDKYIGNYVQDATYFAKLFIENECVFQTPAIKISVPTVENEPSDDKDDTQDNKNSTDKWNFLDFWYWGSNN